MYRTARKNAIWHPPIPIILIPDSPTASDAESDPAPWDGNSSSEEVYYVPAGPEIALPDNDDSEGVDYVPTGPEIELPGDDGSDGVDYVPAGPEIEIPGLEDSEGDDVQILEPLPIPVIDLGSEEEMDIEEVEVSGPPPASEEDLEDEDKEELEMDISEDTMGEKVELVEFDELILSFEEYREIARDSSQLGLLLGSDTSDY
jgi:hypothetical protein